MDGDGNLVLERRICSRQASVGESPVLNPYSIVFTLGQSTIVW
jgi:hypothetical protein